MMTDRKRLERKSEMKSELGYVIAVAGASLAIAAVSLLHWWVIHI